MFKRSALLTGTAVLLSTAVCGCPRPGTSPDLTFMQDAAMGNVGEVTLGQLAVQNAVNAEVRAFGQRMIDDHTLANTRLKTVAALRGVTLPDQPTEQQMMLFDQLQNLSGDEFDRTYISAMVTDHQEDIAKYQDEIDTGQDAAVVGYAEQTLPTLQEHLSLAQSIALEIGAP